MPTRGSILIAALLALTLAGRTGHAQEPADVPGAIEWQLARLTANQAVDWPASARLQKLGAPAAEALVSRLRAEFEPVMVTRSKPFMEVLAKMGVPAVRALDAALTPALLSSTRAEDLDFVKRSTAVLAQIGADQTAATLVRVMRSSPSDDARVAAARGLLGNWPARSRLIGIGESCLGRHWSACPFDSDVRAVSAAVIPFGQELRDVLASERSAQVRLLLAAVLVRFGDDAVRQAGEQALTTLVAASDDYIAQQSIEYLGGLGVAPARSVIGARAAASTNDPLRRTSATALERLQDPLYVPLRVSLMSSQTLQERHWAIDASRQSRNLAFVPALIDRLDDPGASGNSRSVTGADGRSMPVPVTIGDEALAALRALTFQEFGRDPAPWRAWWASSQQVPWSTHLTRFMSTVMSRAPQADPGQLNDWMAQLGDAPVPEILPFLRVYLRHPRANSYATGSNRAGVPLPTFRLLTQLVAQGSQDARELLYECLAVEKLELIRECPDHVAAFDPPRATARLVELLAPGRQARLAPDSRPSDFDFIRFEAAETLLALGDARAMPVLIELLGTDGSKSGSHASTVNRLLRYYTQEVILLEPDPPAAARRTAQEAWRRWWDANRDTRVVNVRAARIDLDRLVGTRD